jgi:hypothetical protein
MFDPDKSTTVGSSKDPQFDEFAAPSRTKTQSPQNKPALVIDESKSQMLLRQLRDNQNLTMGFVGGLGAAALGSVVWATITALTYYQIGFMAVGVGFLVGFAVRKMGQGVDPTFGYLGAGLSLLGCLVGNLLTTCIVVSQQENVALSEVLAGLNPSVAMEIMTYTFSPIDLLFYGLALYYGYKFSFRQLSEDELKSITSITRPAQG